MENKTNQEIFNKLTAIESLLEATHLDKLTAIESLLEGTHQVKPRTLVEAAKFLDSFTSSLVNVKFRTSSQTARRFILMRMSLSSGSSVTLPEPRKKRKKKRQAILFPGKGQYET